MLALLYLQGRCIASAGSNLHQYASGEGTAASRLIEELCIAVAMSNISEVEQRLLSLDDETLHRCLPQAISIAATVGDEDILRLFATTMFATTNGAIRPEAALAALPDAVQSGYLWVVEVLLAVPGVDIAALEGGVASQLLPMAIRQGDINLVRLLVEAGALVSQPDATGRLPLDIAVACGYADIVQCLRAAGATGAGVIAAEQDGAPYGTALPAPAVYGHEKPVDHPVT